MDMVVHTPHGVADIEVVGNADELTVADVIAEVTGQAAPSIASVDGRTVDTGSTLVDAAIAHGSVVDTRLPPPSGAETAIVLAQLTGRGAGVAAELPEGRYRLGPGRRVNAHELADGPVEQSKVVLDVRADEVVVEPVGDVRLGGRRLDHPTRWEAGLLDVEGRTFAAGPAHDTGAARRPAPYPNGTIAFRRRPRGEVSDRRLLRSAVLDAERLGEQLWQRRSTDPDGHVIPFGLDDADRTVSVDLRSHHGVALVGDEGFTVPLARALVCEAVTMHGPADLRVAIASSSRRLALWEWAKWLPHVRTAAGPALLAERSRLESWAAGRSTTTPNSAAAASERWKPPTATAMRTAGTITLLVLDDLGLWSRRDSPLRSLLTSPPADVRVIALCGGLHEAPGLCSVLIESDEYRPGWAILHDRAVDPPTRTDDVRPALPTADVAERIARGLAPLDDLEVDHVAAGTRPIGIDDWFDIVLGLAGPATGQLHARHPGSASSTPHPHDARVAAIAARWAAADSTDTTGRALSIGLGLPAHERLRDDQESVRLDLAAARVALVESSTAAFEPVDRRRIDDVVATLVYGAALERPPTTLSIITVGTDGPEPLPHLAGHHRTGDHRTGDHRTGDDRADDHRAGDHRAGDHRAGDHRTGDHRAGDRRAGDDPSAAPDRGEHPRGEARPDEVASPGGDGFDPARLIRRIGQQIAEDGRDVLVVIRLVRDDDALTRLVTGLIELAAALPQVHLVVAADDPTLPAATFARSRCGAHALVGTSGISTLATRGAPVVSCTPPTIVDADTGNVVVRPAVVARTMTSLERRIARRALSRAARRGEPAGALAELAGAVRDAAAATGSADRVPSLLPPPLPGRVDGLRLRADHPGDAVPIGLLDRPERAEFEPLWWTPGTSLLVVAPPRSGLGAIVDAAVLGHAERFAADDAHLYGIIATPRRRRALDALPHTGAAVGADDGPGIERVVAVVEQIVESRLDGETYDGPAVTVVVDDLARAARSPNGPADLAARLAAIADRGERVHVGVLVVVPRPDAAGALLHTPAEQLVSVRVDTAEASGLDVPASDRSEQVPGRCWARRAQRWTQVAEIEPPVDGLISAVGPLEPARARPPRRPGEEPW